MAQMRIERTASLDGATLTVHERISNVGKLGRMYNMVQHPSIAPPFLDEETVVDAYVMNGFAQPKANEALTHFGIDQVRRLTSDPSPNVVSFVAAGEVGWVTAVSPKSRLLIGYVWDTKHYPWLNLWRHVENGRPALRGSPAKPDRRGRGGGDVVRGFAGFAGGAIVAARYEAAESG